MQIDFNKAPEIEYDDSGSGILDAVWRSDDGNTSFSMVIQDGSIIGISCSLKPPTSSSAWKVSLPKGFIKIDCGTVDQQITPQEG